MPSESPETVIPDVAEIEPALTLSYEKVWASERERALAANPLEGYEQLAVGEGVADEDALTRLAEGLVSFSQPQAWVLWNRESGEVYVSYNAFVHFNKRQGYHQHKAGFTRYEARYVDPVGRKFKEIRKDFGQDWEVGRVERFDEVSEPLSSEHPDHDSELSAAVEQAVRDAMNGDRTVALCRDTEDWMVTNEANTNRIFEEFDPGQRWVFFRTHRQGAELEDLARRVGLNCRVYRKEAALVAHGYNGSFHDIFSDREQLMVPVGIKVG